MFLIKTRLAPSPTHWIGVFADEEIKKWTVVREVNPSIDQEIHPVQMGALPEHVRDNLMNYAFSIGGTYILLAGDDRFTNHSFSPTTGDVTDPITNITQNVALTDLHVWDEITDDYTKYMDSQLDRIHLQNIQEPHDLQEDTWGAMKEPSLE